MAKAKFVIPIGANHQNVTVEKLEEYVQKKTNAHVQITKSKESIIVEIRKTKGATRAQITQAIQDFPL